MKKRTYIFVITIIIVILSSTIGVSALVQNSKNYVDSEKKESIITNAKNYSDAIKNDRNSVVARINGKDITKKDVYFNKMLNSNNSSEILSSKEIMVITAKYKIVFIEAEKYGLSLTEQEIEEINQKELISYEKNSEENERFAIEIGYTKEELIEMMVDMRTHMETKVRLSDYLFKSLFAGEDKFKTKEIDVLFKEYCELEFEDVLISDYASRIFELYLDNLFQNSKLEILDLELE